MALVWIPSPNFRDSSITKCIQSIAKCILCIDCIIHMVGGSHE